MRTISIFLLSLVVLAIVVAPDLALAQQAGPGPAGNASGADPFSYESFMSKNAAPAPGPAGPNAEAAAKPGDGQPPYTRDDYLRDQRNYEFARDQLILQAVMIALLCVVTVVSLVLILKYLASRNASSAQLVSGAGLTLLIFGTVFLAYVVVDKDQLTASVGILGAIAGYLFGTAQRHTTSAD